MKGVTDEIIINATNKIFSYFTENLFPIIVFICIITDNPPNENKAVIIGKSPNISFSNSVSAVISIKEFIITVLVNSF